MFEDSACTHLHHNGNSASIAPIRTAIGTNRSTCFFQLFLGGIASWMMIPRQRPSPKKTPLKTPRCPGDRCARISALSRITQSLARVTNVPGLSSNCAMLLPLRLLLSSATVKNSIAFELQIHGGSGLGISYRRSVSYLLPVTRAQIQTLLNVGGSSLL
jgi:hypothetical protein